MATIAIVIYQLRSKMRLRRWSASEIAMFVFQADDQLAALVERLPSHLQNDEPVTPETQARDAKTRLAMTILYYRLSINRVLQTHWRDWLEGSTNYARARIVCFSSAVGVIHSAVARSADRLRLRSWDFAMVVFSAAITLALEVQGSTEQISQFVEAVIAGKEFLKGS
ncbi:hypothetical protein BDV96DRAFT_656137 [Lophiotrema nucula]|uniref:Uncharacterized protein n=1 Tax=Lophiotrema nucula TaxID=690887 RepID=A0A6A5ZTI2_9PLEO|nr:hypothetical protein BDV96DRAFT_656137 [Lophiotrema nucula]